MMAAISFCTASTLTSLAASGLATDSSSVCTWKTQRSSGSPVSTEAMTSTIDLIMPCCSHCEICASTPLTNDVNASSVATMRRSPYFFTGLKESGS